MKRSHQRVTPYQPLDGDVQIDAEKLRRLRIDEIDGIGATGHATIVHATDNTYWLRTADMTGIKADRSLASEDFPLVAGDHVRIRYTQAKNLKSSDMDMVVDEISAESRISVGKVTAVRDDMIIIDESVRLPVDSGDVDRRSLMQVGMMVDYCAVRNDESGLAHRCIWARPIVDAERLKTVCPDLKILLEKVVRVSQNTGGILVPDELVFACSEIGESKVSDLSIQNLSDTDRSLLSLDIAKDGFNRPEQFFVEEPDLATTGLIKIPGKSAMTVRIRAQCTALGITTDSLVLHFNGNVSSLCRLRMVAGDEQFLDTYRNNTSKARHNLTSNRTIFRNQQLVWQGPRRIHHHLKPQSRATTVKFREWEMSEEIAAFLQQDTSRWDGMLIEGYSYLPAPLSPFNYSEKWHDLLWLDEMVLFRSFQVHNRFNVVLQPETGRHEYSVSGHFAECRPSILPGDRLHCTSFNQKFDGLVIRLQHEKAVIRMQAAFEPFALQRWNTTFKFARNTYKSHHQMVDRPQEQLENDQWLFPMREKVSKQLAQLDVHLVNGQLVLGSERPLKLTRPDFSASQKNALKNICRGEYRSVPYLISGPPGTGKTTVLVELINLLGTLLDSRILVCTQSNSAANLLTQKLVQSQCFAPIDIVRIVSKNVSHAAMESVPGEIRPLCRTLVEVDEQQESSVTVFSKTELMEQLSNPPPSIPPPADILDASVLRQGEDTWCSSVNLATLLETRVLITTCGTANYMCRMPFPTDHLTHLLIDEAAQCLEPEALIPMSLMEKSEAQLVMAGDINQLSPQTHWDTLAECGYTTSLFERLLLIPGLYQESAEWKELNDNLWPVVPELYCKLVENYRNGASILALFNSLFYQNALTSAIVCKALHLQILRLIQLALPKSSHRSVDHGVFFLSVIGENQRLHDDPSWYNASEAEVVLEVYHNIARLGVNVANDVAILSPYQGQVKYIRAVLKQRGMTKCRVHSVEEFQGQEATAVILSTVRSSNKFAELDRGFDLGFLNNPRRTNVALSRSQCALIIVGNAPVLSGDPLWKKIINYCVQNYAFEDTQEEIRNNIM